VVGTKSGGRIQAEARQSMGLSPVCAHPEGGSVNCPESAGWIPGHALRPPDRPFSRAQKACHMQSTGTLHYGISSAASLGQTVPHLKICMAPTLIFWGPLFNRRPYARLAKSWSIYLHLHVLRELWSPYVMLDLCFSEGVGRGDESFGGLESRHVHTRVGHVGLLCSSSSGGSYFP
jgi:hypothetical protein